LRSRITNHKRNIGQGTSVALQSLGAVNIEVVLTTLLTEIAEFPEDVVFVLDDYQVAETQPIELNKS
jgi:ATP/maltotriose-dependent transcriptional regulator MalT